MNNQIASTTKLLNSFRISCERERREMEHLQNENARLETTVTEFKSNNEEYLDKIKQVAYEEVGNVLNDSKLLLKVATLSIIESLRMNSEIYDDFVLSDDSYAVLILEEAEKLYNELIIELTNRTMAATAAMKTLSLPLPLSSSNKSQKSKD